MLLCAANESNHDFLRVKVKLTLLADAVEVSENLLPKMESFITCKRTKFVCAQHIPRTSFLQALFL